MEPAKRIEEYEWLDEVEYKDGEAKILRVAEILGKYEFEWDERWLDMLEEDMYNTSYFVSREPKIFREIFEKVCKDRGFVPEERIEDGQKITLPLDPDFVTIARTEAKAIFAPIKAMLGNLRHDGTLKFGLRHRKLHLPLFFRIEGKKAVLRDEYKDVLKTTCTHRIPESYRPLFDFAVSEKDYLRMLWSRADIGDELPSFLRWISSNEPTAKSFGLWLGI